MLVQCPIIMSRVETKAIVLAGVVAILAVLPYLGALENPLVYDDLRTVVGNPSIRDLGNVRAVLLYERFRPATNVTYALDYALWGPRPFGYHLTSVVLHAACAVLFFAVTRTAFRDRRLLVGQAPPADSRKSAGGACPTKDSLYPGFAASALFAVHPMMTEAVGYVSGRSEVLCGVFFLAAFLLLRGFLANGGTWRLAAGLFGFAGALAAREVGAMLPFVLVAYDVLLLGGSQADRRRRLLRFHLPLSWLPSPEPCGCGCSSIRSPTRCREPSGRTS